MVTYYKATKPDGTDFHTGTVQYTVGESLPRIPARKGVKRECCTDTVYHASDTPSETLIGGSWPARLFEVTGRKVASEGHKHGFVTLRVKREIEAWRALGPNGEDVVKLIEQAKLMTPSKAEELMGARVAARDAARVAAGYAASAAVVRDLITPEQYHVLTHAWFSVMGEI